MAERKALTEQARKTAEAEARAALKAKRVAERKALTEQARKTAEAEARAALKAKRVAERKALTTTLKLASKETADALSRAEAAEERAKQATAEATSSALLDGTTPHGFKVTARSGKELRRFVKPQDLFVLSWLRRFEPGDVFYDIGANCGGVSFAVAGIHGEAVKIVAIEPSFASFESLARNLSDNRLLGFTVPLQVALLDETGLLPMNYRSTAAGTSLHSVGQAVDHEGKPFEPVEVQLVPTYTLDDLVGMLKLPAPTWIKIDVDGYEEPVLRGSAATMKAGSVKELVIEVVDHDRSGTRLATLSKLLDDWGYALVDTLHHGGDGSFVADHRFSRRELATG